MEYEREIEGLLVFVHERHPNIIMICVTYQLLDALKDRLTWSSFDDNGKKIEGWTLLGIPVEIEKELNRPWEAITCG